MIRSILSILFYEKTSIKFALGVLLGMAFSISVILATVGIMDGFDKTLKSGLRRSVGDMFFYSSEGFFEVDQSLKDKLKDKDVVNFSPLVQT